MRAGLFALVSCVLVSAAVPGCAPVSHDGEPLEFTLSYPPTVPGGYEIADRFLTDDEAAAIVESFDWADTEALPETREDGTPTVYYVVMQIDSPEAYELLEAARVPFDIQPLFASERRVLPDAPLSMSGSNAYGGWAFALLAGEMYNIARDAALAGEPLYSIIALREPPADAPTHDDGAIDLAALGAMGFQWPEPSATPEPGLATSALSEVISDFGRAFAEFGDFVARTWSDFWGFILGSGAMNTVLTLDLTISTPDPDFQPVMEPLLRTWSPGRGNEISNVGQEIWAEQLVFPFARWRANLGVNNVATITLPSGSTVRFCTLNAIPGRTSVHDFWLPTRTCSPAQTLPAAPALMGGVRFAEQNLQALTIADDGVAFMAVQQIGIRAPSIAANNHGQLVAITGNGFVPGLGGRDPASTAAINALDWIAPFLSAVGPVRPGLNVDIVWPPGNPSRVVFAHELGHHIFYQMMNTVSNEVNPFLYAIHIISIFVGTLANPGMGELGFGGLTVNEALADVIGYQISGGWNLMSNGVFGGYPGDAIGTGGGVNEGYCDPTMGGPGTPICYDVNFVGTEFGPGALYPGGNPGLRSATSARLATLLHDIIDDFPGGAHHNGPVWAPVAGTCAGAAATPPLPCPSATMLVALPGPSAGLAEEPVALPFTMIERAIQSWLRTFPDQFAINIDVFVRGLTRALRFVGTPDATTCQLYGLHTPGGACPPVWMP